MLRDTQELIGCTLRESDGELGTVKDFYFDDHRWVVRYLVVETGSWLTSRRVLVSPHSVLARSDADRNDRVLRVSITAAQVRGSPDIDTERPVSRQHEAEMLGYYGYPVYWDSAGLWGTGALPGAMMGGPLPDLIGAGAAAGATLPGAGGAGTGAGETAASHPGAATGPGPAARHDDPHLRAAKEVRGYRIRAIDGEIGHVDGYVFDEATWQLRYLVVDTARWWAGQKVLVAPQWIHEVRWEDRDVVVDLSREQVRTAPAWDSIAPPERALEEAIYRHYDRNGYW